MCSGRHVVHLSQIRPGDLAIVGAKAYNVWQLTQFGVSSVPGFVVTTSCLDDYLAFNGATPFRSSVEVPPAGGEVERRATAIVRVILDGRFPEYLAASIREGLREIPAESFAVRSSSSVEDHVERSWAGRFSTSLSVQAADVLDALRTCWASLYSTEVLHYVLTNPSIDINDLRMAVLVQGMIDGDFSGVAFSIDPVTQESDIAVVEAIPGLGERLVSGQTKPDRFYVHGLTGTVVSKQMHARPETGHLDEVHARKVARTALYLSDKFGRPQDMEWTLIGHDLRVLQSRPITALPQRSVELESYLIRRRQFFNKIYSSRGLPFLYESLISNNYIRWENLIFCFDGGDSVFANRVQLESAVGRPVKDGIAWLAEAKARFVNVAERIGAATDGEPNGLLSLFGQLLAEYGKFDSNLWGFGLFSSAAEAEQCVEFILGNKNILRQTIDNVFFDEGAPFRRYIAALSEKLKLEEADVLWLSEDELRDIDDVKPFPAIIARRRTGVSLYRDANGAVTLFNGGQARTLYNDFSSNRSVQGELSGTPISSEAGEIVGRARIVRRDYSQVGASLAGWGFEDGDILVTEMTDPSFDPIIRRALGVVTELGGLLSHPAISARECGVPCIVGVDGAMSAIRDGQIISMDLVRGVIRHLEEC